MSPEIIKEKNHEQTDHRSRLGEAAVQLIDDEKLEEHELKDRRVVRLTPIYTPNEVLSMVERTKESTATVENGRKAAIDIMSEKPKDDRLLVVVGPCSIHDEEAALEYAGIVKDYRKIFGNDLEVVMRTYLEKPRTTVGWKGYINDPKLDESFAINEGLVNSRRLLAQITDKGVPVATELLDTSTPQYIADMVSYGAIGARTTESQLHRELVSGVSFPVGFKNGTGGSIEIAINAIKSAAEPHNFIGIDKEGRSAVVETLGNEDCNIILRGSSKGPNYHESDVANAAQQLKKAGLSPAIMIDVSHANSGGDFLSQPIVAKNVARQIANGNTNIRGLMIESNLEEGKQAHIDQNGDPIPKENLVYGQSITDACLGPADTRMMMEFLADSVKRRRNSVLQT